MGVAMLIAGHETSASMIPLGTLALLREPRPARRAARHRRPEGRRRRGRGAAALPDASCTPGVRRIALEDIEIGGQVIRARRRHHLRHLRRELGRRDVPRARAARPEPRRPPAPRVRVRRRTSAWASRWPAWSSRSSTARSTAASPPCAWPSRSTRSSSRSKGSPTACGPCPSPGDHPASTSKHYAKEQTHARHTRRTQVRGLRPVRAGRAGGVRPARRGRRRDPAGRDARRGPARRRAGGRGDLPRGGDPAGGDSERGSSSSVPRPPGSRRPRRCAGEGYDGTITLVGDEPTPRTTARRCPSSSWPREWEPDRLAAAPAGRPRRAGPRPAARRHRDRPRPRPAGRCTWPTASRSAYDGLIVATGVRPRRLPGAGAHVLRTLDDALALRDRLSAGPAPGRGRRRVPRRGGRRRGPRSRLRGHPARTGAGAAGPRGRRARSAGCWPRPTWTTASICAPGSR